MLIIKLVRFLFGYLKINLWGKFPERFLNLCACRGVKVWNTRRRGEYIEFCIFARDYKKLRTLRHRCPVSVRSKSKHGLPFITKRYHRRKGLVVGLAIYIAALAMMPKFVWGVNISGNKQISDERLRTALHEVGIYPGVRVDDVDAANMRLRLALLLPDVSWAAVNVEGAFVNVEIREAEHKQTTDIQPCNIVADCDGRITAVYVRRGSATVKVGDGVRKGDMLVSGTEQYASGVTKFRHSDADIIAEVEKSLTVKIPLNQIKTTYTGRVQSRRVLTVFNYDIPLYIGGVDYDYKLESHSRPVVVQGTVLPFTITEGKFRERVQTPYKLTKAQAEKTAMAELERLQQTRLCDYEILSRTLDLKYEKNRLVLRADYLCKGNIAKKEYIYISE